ncbi:MAG: 50S ribosomal protein L11 methyltransferase [Bacteroidetes bacterium]|nr:50S ribosomal protein L11 methyltransferase [Bacteroidota bacterium]
MKKGKLIKISIGYDGKSYEDLTAFLYTHGITSFEERDTAIDIYLQPEEKDKFLDDFMNNYGSGNAELVLEEIENRNWNEDWEKSIEPVFIADKIIIYPSWKKDEIKKYKKSIKIQIDPKMAFGTGHNETTCLVLELMTKHLGKKPGYLLDYGCGTGVLAIAGIKMGALKAAANETDEDSIDNAKECFAANRVSKKVKLYHAPLEGVKEKNFDVICANIISSVIIGTLGLMKSKLKKNGKLFLSGILNEEKRKISSALKKHGFEIEEIQSRAEWLGIYARNTK